MLQSLHIRNYILISSLDIDFPKGLIIITGQTGAGKSILLGALSLLSGGKADASMIAANADSCVVEAQYFEDSDSIKDLLSEEDIDWCDGQLIVRRSISSSGRSRCFVNDCPVNQAFLNKLSAFLIDIHSQHSSLLLANKAFQLSVLDNFAGNFALLTECRGLWKELGTAKNELKELNLKLSELQSEKDFNTAQLSQLLAAKINSEDELELLEAEQKTLAYAEEIKSNLRASLNVFSPNDDSGFLGITHGLKESVKSLDKISKYLPKELSALCERIESVRVELSDIEAELEDIDSRIDVSPDKLQIVEERMSLLYSLMKKFNCSNIAELIAVRESYKEKLLDSSSLEDKIQQKKEHIDILSQNWEQIAQELHKKRCESAPKLSISIENDLHFLELDKAEFRIEVQTCDSNIDGIDSVQYLFSANGTKAQDVSKVASGGELSRIMLCLKATMAKFMGMPTMIFDEIDTGVSGSVADKIGQMICTMGANMQLLSITHLPQVAAKGDAHYVVSKYQENGQTISTLTRIEGEERVREIARLLSGTNISNAALENARTLLSEANLLL